MFTFVIQYNICVNIYIKLLVWWNKYVSHRKVNVIFYYYYLVNGSVGCQEQILNIKQICFTVKGWTIKRVSKLFLRKQLIFYFIVIHCCIILPISYDFKCNNISKTKDQKCIIIMWCLQLFKLSVAKSLYQ